MAEQQLKLFHVTDYETFAAFNAEEALKLWQEMFGPDNETTLADVSEVPDKELDEEFPELDINEEETGKITTMRAQLSEMKAPGIFWQVM